jgi:hypothetical protein
MKKVYVQIDGELIEKSTYYADPVAPMVMPDIQPYQSMADGSMITSRSHHREHLRQHNCIEIGNESMERKAPQLTNNRREILQAQLANMTHDQANRMLSKARDDLRFTRR